MPLAIELAARWLPVLSCHEIAGEIRTNLDFLATSQKDVPERQQSLRAVFNQAWALLATTEQTAFVRLSVFRWVFDRAAAEAVADASLAVLASLVDKGLLRSEGPTTIHSEVRFSVHAVLRRYVWQRLGRPAGRTGKYPGPAQPALPELPGAEAGGVGRTPATSCSRGVRRPVRQRSHGVGMGCDTQRDRGSKPRVAQSYLFCTMRSWFHVGEGMFGRLVVAYSSDDAARSGEHAALLGVALACQGWFTFQLGAHSQADKLLHRGWRCSGRNRRQRSSRLL